LIEPAQLTVLVAELETTTYHTALRTYLERRIASLLVDDVTDPYVAMKRRGQVEELQRLLMPAATHGLALLALERRAAATATAEAADTLPIRPRDWWVNPGDEPVQ
jgi:hypothetical protein